LKAKSRYKLLFGGNQSGKSHTAAYDLICYARGIHPYNDRLLKGDIVIWVVSAEYTTIRTGIYKHLKNLIPDWEIERVGPNVPGHELPTFIRLNRTIGGSCEIYFMSAKGDSRQKFQAEAVNIIYIDEEVPDNIVEEIEARTISTGGWFNISATLVESFDWLTELETRAERGDSTVFLTRLDTTQNPYANKEAVSYFLSKWSYETQEFRIKGKSRRSTGLVFKNWVHKHEIAPFKIPKEWPRWCAVDPGFRVCAVLWITVDEKNHAYAYRELYARNEALYSIAIAIKSAERWTLNQELSQQFGHFVWEETDESEHMVDRIIDDKRNSRLITGDFGVLEQLYSKYGLLCTPADKNRHAGIEDCRFWLEDLSDNKPGFSAFNILDHFITEIRNYRFRTKRVRKDQNDPIDEPVKRDDHLMDDFRYLARIKPKYQDREAYPYVQKTKSIEDIMREKREKVYENEFLGACV